MTSWTLHPDCPKQTREVFQTLDDVFELSGKAITSDRLSDLIYVTIDGTGYYVKRYYAAGKGIRRWLGRPRLCGEWQNLQRFDQWNLSAARLAAFGMEKRGPFFKRGAAITVELHETKDLAALVHDADPRLNQSLWVQAVSQQLAHATRVMHSHRFAHGDLKWRNILVNQEAPPQIYLIDCPDGKRWIPPFLQYRKNKDLACLDKYGNQVLSRTQRLRFYLDYLEKETLSKKDKRNLRHILRFFRGRE